MSKWLGLLALLVAGAAGAADQVYKRGEYEFAVGPVPGFVEEGRIPDRWDPAAPGQDDQSWRVWLFEEQVDRRAGRDQVYVDYAWEARASSLLGSAGKFDIDFNPGYQRLVIHRLEVRRDGHWSQRLVPDKISLARRETDFEKDMSDGNVTALIVIDDVRVDDVVRIAYSIVGSNPILAGQVVDYNRFAWRSPILDERMRVLYEPGAQPHVMRAGNAPEAAIRRAADMTEVAVRQHGAAAMPDEGSYPVWYEPGPVVRTSITRSWSDVVAWALPLYPKADALPADLEARLAKWAKLPDAQSRLSAALRAVQDDVRYFGVEMGDNTHKPHPPADTWTRRYGDCKDKAYLLSNLLQRLGIEAAPALVSTTRGRGIIDTPPAASVFNHVIVRARVDGQSYWVDPTMTAQGGQARDTDLSDYGMGLVIAPGTQTLETIQAPARLDSGIEAKEQYELRADGSARLRIKTTYRGREADDLRQALASEGAENRSRRYAEHYRKRFGEVTVAAPLAVGDDRVRNVVVIDEDYLIATPYETATSGRALDVYADVLADPARLPESMARTSPLAFGEPGKFRHEIEVTLPKDWVSSLRDEKTEYASKAFSYTRETTVKDRSVQIVYDMDVRQRDVGQQDVSAHLGELRKVRDTLSTRLNLRTPGQAQNKERDDRLKALLRDSLEEGTTP